jgi:hypothetical protein
MFSHDCPPFLIGPLKALPVAEDVAQYARFGAKLGVQNLRPPRSQDFSDLWIVAPSKYPCTAHTGLHAGWQPATQYPIQAEPAFVDQAGILIIGSSIVGAGNSAVLAAHAGPVVDKNHPARVVVGSLGRTDPLARWLLAVLALNRQAPATSFWLLLLADATDKALAVRELVTLIAGIHACPAATALVEIDDQYILTLDLLHRLREGDPFATDCD